MIRAIITPNIPKAWEKDYLLREGGNAKTLKAFKLILKTIEKAHRNNEVEQEPSGNKAPKEPAHNPTDNNKCRSNGHNHLWKNCPTILTRSTTTELTIQRFKTRNAPVRPRPARTGIQVLIPTLNRRGPTRRRDITTGSAGKLAASTVSIPTPAWSAQ